MNRPLQVAALAIASSSLFATSANAQCELEQLKSATAFAPLAFGEVVTLSSERAVVSAFINNERGYQVFTRFGMDWYPTEVLTPRVGTNFNIAMDMDKDTVVCGLGNDGTYGEVDPSAPAPSGEVDVFDLKTPGGFVKQTLLPSDAEAGQRFGVSVAIDGKMMAIGSPGESTIADSSGAVYLFELIAGEWVETAKIKKDDPQAFENFGSDIELNDGRLLVKGGFGNVIFLGGPQLDTAAIPGGLVSPFFFDTNVFVFEQRLGEWFQTAELEGNPARVNSFGRSMAVSGDTIMIGARVGSQFFTDIPMNTSPTTIMPPIGPLPPISTDNFGVVLVYEKQGQAWVNVSALRASDNVTVDDFGASLDIEGDWAVIGSPLSWGNDGLGAGTGGAFAYTKTDHGWRQARLLHSNVDGMLNGMLGSSVALVDGMAILGAPQAEIAGANAGKAYAYGIGPDCSGNGRSDSCDIMHGLLSDTDGDMVPDMCETGDVVPYCDGSMNSAGMISELDVEGETSLGMNHFALHVRDATPNQFGLFIASNGSTHLPFGAGMRCVGGFHNAQFSAFADDTGEVMRDVDTTLSSLGITPYTSMTFQFVYRDGPEVHLTNAIRVTFMP